MAKKTTKPSGPTNTTHQLDSKPSDGSDEAREGRPKPSEETFRIGKVSYTVLEKTTQGVLRLRYVSPTVHRDGSQDHRDFFYDPEIKRKVERGQEGKWVPAKGIIPGTQLGPRKGAEKRSVAAPAPRKVSPPPATPLESEMIRLSNRARTILDEYIALSGAGGSRDEVASKFLMEHLGKEVEKLREGASLVKKFGSELLDDLSGFSPEDLRRMIASAKKG